MSRPIEAPLGRAEAEVPPVALRLPLLAAAGAAAALGLAPADQPALALAGLALAFLIARAGPRFWDGWAFGLGWFAVALRWIVEPFLVEPEIHGWMAPFALALMVGGMALFWGLAWGLAGRLRLGLAGLVALWAAAELLRAHAFTGFPWAMPGHVWIDTPLVQSAAWWGAHGLTLFTLGAAALIVAACPVWLRLAPLAAILAGLFLLGPGPAPAPDPAAPVLRLVQPNVPQAEKWDPDLQPLHRARLLELSRGPGADLVVWPETAITDLLEDAGPILAAAVAGAEGAPVAAGVVRAEGGRWFNSLALAGEGGRVLALYDKVHLTPFGEYVPFGEVLARWGIHGFAASHGGGFTPGPGPRLMDLPGIGPARPLICYEGIFPEEIAAPGGRPRLLLLVTNDAWFGAGAGPEQHLALGRLRAVEQGLPLMRSANTGISAAIDARGRVLASLPLNEAGRLDAPLPPAGAATLYAQSGDWPALAAVALLLAWAWRRRAPAPAPAAGPSAGPSPGPAAAEPPIRVDPGGGGA